MGLTRLLAGALLVSAAFVSAPVSANTCQADGMTCPTGMPVEGYCECTAHGVTKSGTVIGVSGRAPRQAPRTDCRATPDAPGCAPQ